MGDDSQRYSVTSSAIEDVDLSIIRQVSFDSGIVDYEEETVTSLTRNLDTEDDMSEEEDWAQETIEK